MTIEQLYSIYRQYPSIQTDSRKIQAGDLFFALKGPHFNGNQFAAGAIAAGAAYAIVDEVPAVPDDRIIPVSDVLTTLQSLAGHHRNQFTIPFIAITGSNGKTTTKELVHSVLSAAYTTYTTRGNLNNHIGIPLTLLGIRDDAQMAVVEMGANHLKEIEGYCVYTRPTHGIITNCGKAHLEGFGSPEGVRKGKGELYDYLKTHDGTAFVMWDYSYLQDMSKGIPHIVRYGTADGMDVSGSISQNAPFLVVEMGKETGIGIIRTQLVGDYNLPNVLAAVAAGLHFGVPPEKIRAAIENYTPSNSRSQLLEKDGNKIILDAYNANPTSMKLAIENLAHIPAANKILMLGGMAELGPDSRQEHQAIIGLIKKYNWQEVVLVGGDFLTVDHPFRKFEDSEAAARWFREQHFTDAYILIKGSRSMQMEKIPAG